MATTTPNFGWSVPTSSDLVKNGAVAIETLGDAIDASLVDLKGGTTGQVLAKASNTDMDFVWSADSSGLKKITSATFTSQTAVSVNSCFSATYDVYLLEVRYISTSGTSTMTMKFRASGADQDNNYYYGYTGANNSGVAQTYSGSNTAGSQIGLSGTAEGCLSSHTIYNPNNSSRKLFVGGWSNGDSSIYVSGGGQRSNTTAADGFSLLFSAASTGLYAIYGLEK